MGLVAAFDVFDDDAGCGALVGYFFYLFYYITAEAAFVVFADGCDTVTGVLENFGQPLVAEGASGAEILVDVNFYAAHCATSSLDFDGKQL